MSQRVHRRVYAGRKERPDQPSGLRLGAFPPVGGGVDLRAPAVGAERLAPAGLSHPGDGVTGVFRPAFPHGVAGAESIEHRHGVGEQVLAPLLRHAHRVREDAQREDLGQIANSVEGAPFHQFLGQRFRDVRPSRLERLQPGGKHPIDDGPGPVVLGRVRLEQQRGIAPGRLPGEVGEPDAPA